MRYLGRVVASIEARMASSRLPGKMLCDIVGKSTLERVVSRLRAVPELSAIVVATTASSEDDDIASEAERLGVDCFRGSSADVLGRVVDAHQRMASDVVVQICGDCPLLDPQVVSQCIRMFEANDVEFVSNALTQSYPQGTEVSVMKLSTLKQLSEQTSDSAHREHVTLGLIEQLPDAAKLCLVAPPFLTCPELRLQLDYEEDLNLIRCLYNELENSDGEVFCLPDILSVLRLKPEIGELNRYCKEAAVR
ncbi:glycosyltransferase family protein [uncultured Thalassospira sp.]|uniref:glycosyltransferase family protein n=1 Tax=uncultured Thalassospira sp. TaxID=404382 RepID=UPI0032B22CA1